MKTPCDAANLSPLSRALGEPKLCGVDAVFECGCRRCQSEPEIEERYFTCGACHVIVNEAHERVHGCPAQWRRL